MVSITKRIPRRWRAGLWALLLGWTAALIVLNIGQVESRVRKSHTGLANGLIERSDTAAYDWLFANRGPEPPIPEIVIVEISDRAVNNLENTLWSGVKVRFPFPRAMHGALFQKLKAAGAKVIAPDILFEGASSYSDADDHAFATAVRACQNVILAASFTHSRSSQIDDMANADQFPYAPLREACLDFGPVNPPQDFDLAVRRFSPTLSNISLRDTTRDQDYPIFAVRIAAAYSGISNATLSQQLAHKEFGGFLIAYAPDNIADNAPGDTVRIDYAGYPKQSCRYIAYDQVLNGAFPPDLFRDKIVLIGSTVSSEHVDELATPLMRDSQEESKRPGVEIHANIIHTLLSHHYITMFPHPARVVLIILSALMATALTLRYRPVKAAILIALMVVGIPALSVALFNSHYFLRPTQPVAACLLGYGFESIYFYIFENRRANEIRHRFGRYVGPRVLSEIVDAEELTLSANRAYVTVMFTDLQGFTSLSEKMAPAEAVALLNEYMNQMVEILFRYDGTLDKVMGDGVMAYFNAPRPVPDHEVKAVQCAQEMQATMQAWRAQCEQMGVPPLRVRVGIHTGEVVVGNMGSLNQMSYTIIGDIVNTAARLEPLNKEFGTEILISEAVQKELPPMITTEYVGEIAIRGRKEGIRAYSVSATKTPN